MQQTCYKAGNSINWNSRHNKVILTILTNPDADNTDLIAPFFFIRNILFHSCHQYSNIKCLHQEKKCKAGERILDVWSRGNKTITLSLLQGGGLDFIKRRWSDEENKSSLYGIESKSKICHGEWSCLTEPDEINLYSLISPRFALLSEYRFSEFRVLSAK